MILNDLNNPKDPKQSQMTIHDPKLLQKIPNKFKRSWKFSNDPKRTQKIWNDYKRSLAIPMYQKIL